MLTSWYSHLCTHPPTLDHVWPTQSTEYWKSIRDVSPSLGHKNRVSARSFLDRLLWKPASVMEIIQQSCSKALAGKNQGHPQTEKTWNLYEWTTWKADPWLQSSLQLTAAKLAPQIDITRDTSAITAWLPTETVRKMENAYCYFTPIWCTVIDSVFKGFLSYSHWQPHRLRQFPQVSAVAQVHVSFAVQHLVHKCWLMCPSLDRRHLWRQAVYFSKENLQILLRYTTDGWQIWEQLMAAT